MVIILALGYAIIWLASDDAVRTSSALYALPFIFIGSLVYIFIEYKLANRQITKFSGAQPLNKKDNPVLYHIVDNLAITEGIPTPAIYLINDEAPNAFASGNSPEEALIGVTTGLLDLLDKRELEGVIAHEIGHIKNYDTRVNTIAFGLVAVIAILTAILTRMFWLGGSKRHHKHVPAILYFFGWLISLIVPFIVAILQLALNRQREYLADASSALTTRNPGQIISALEKIKQHSAPLQNDNPAIAHLFLVSPTQRDTRSLLATHPPIEKRISRLQKSSNKM